MQEVDGVNDELVQIQRELWRKPIDRVRVRALLPRRNELRRSVDPQWYVNTVRPSFAEILDRLATLASLCRARYELRPPLTSSQVEKLEQRIGRRLPEQYRAFVTELADGGCGPAYGIKSMIDADVDLSAPFHPKRASELTRVSSTGAFEIAEIGCGLGYYLVLSGPDAGCIWHYGDYGWAPMAIDGVWRDGDAAVELPRTAKLELVDWYADWLDDELYNIAWTQPDGDDVFDRPPGEVPDVNLKGRKLSAVPEGLRRLTEVRRLQLQNNPFEALPAWIGELGKLERLFLHETGIRTLPEEIAQLRALKILSCFKAKSLVRLPESLGTMTWLEDLDLRYCAIEALPESIGGLTQFAELQIHNNPLTTLPRSIGRLTKLRKLELQYCRITSLPDEIGDLPELAEISLRDNDLAALPPAIGRCRALVSLDLSDNPNLDLAGACRILAQVPALRRLVLCSMKLTRLPDEIGLLTQLEDLHVAYNQFEALPETIVNLKSLRKFDYYLTSPSVEATAQWERLQEQLPLFGTTADDAAYVADVTIPDGTEIIEGTEFVKTWRVRNTGPTTWGGKTTWGRGYQLVHTEGPDFEALGCDVAAAPGEEIDVTLDMVATGEGRQQSTWHLINRDGDYFGEGLIADIVVVPKR